MSSFYTDNFEFMTYDPKDYDHVLALQSLENDPQVQEYLHTISEYLEDSDGKDTLNQAYLVGNDFGIVGYLAMFNYDSMEEFHYATLSEYRGIRNDSNETIGAQIVKEASQEVFDRYRFIKRIRLIIKAENIRSIKTAEACGFKRTDEKPDFVEYQKERKR